MPQVGPDTPRPLEMLERPSSLELPSGPAVESGGNGASIGTRPEMGMWVETQRDKRHSGEGEAGLLKEACVGAGNSIGEPDHRGTM